MNDDYKIVITIDEFEEFYRPMGRLFEDDAERIQITAKLIPHSEQAHRDFPDIDFIYKIIFIEVEPNFLDIVDFHGFEPDGEPIRYDYLLDYRLKKIFFCNVMNRIFERKPDITHIRYINCPRYFYKTFFKTLNFILLRRTREGMRPCWVLKEKLLEKCGELYTAGTGQNLGG